MKQIVISILKTIFKIIKAVLCVAGVMAVILSLEVTKNIIVYKIYCIFYINIIIFIYMN